MLINCLLEPQWRLFPARAVRRQVPGQSARHYGRELLTSLLERRDLSVVDRAFARAALKSNQSSVRRTRNS